jgi:predicted aspartyl protease
VPVLCFACTLRERRLAEYEKWLEEERAKREAEERVKEIRVERDVTTQNILVETLLNDKVKATLVLDTGASLVILSKKMGEELGIDLKDTKGGMVELQMAGDRRIKAKQAFLNCARLSACAIQLKT